MVHRFTHGLSFEPPPGVVVVVVDDEDVVTIIIIIIIIIIIVVVFVVVVVVDDDDDDDDDEATAMKVQRKEGVRPGGKYPSSMFSIQPQISPGVEVELKSSISRFSSSLNFPLKYDMRAVYIDSASHAFRWMMITAMYTAMKQRYRNMMNAVLLCLFFSLTMSKTCIKRGARETSAGCVAAISRDAGDGPATVRLISKHQYLWRRD